MDYDILAVDVPFDICWGDSFGPANSVSSDLIVGLECFTVTQGTGILNIHKGPTFFDAGYDPAADAFLIARVDFNVVGVPGNSVDLNTVVGSIGMVHAGLPLNPIFGGETINVVSLTEEAEVFDNGVTPNNVTNCQFTDGAANVADETLPGSSGAGPIPVRHLRPMIFKLKSIGITLVRP